MLPVAMAYQFKRHESVRAGFRRMAAEQCDGLCSDLVGSVAPDVHEARKRCKMLRALLRLVSGAIDRADFDILDSNVREIGRRLGPARDAEVRRQTFERLLADHSDCDPQPFAAVSRALNAEARAIRRRALSAQSLRRVVNDIGAIRERLCGLELRQRGWTAIERGFHRAYARSRRPLRNNAAQGDKARHAWRKHVKTLWYHARLLHGICGKKMTAFADRLEPLGNLLGDDRDLALLAAHLSAHLLRHAPPRVREPLFALIEKSRSKLFATAKKEAALLFEKKPRGFVRRIEKCWRDRHK